MHAQTQMHWPARRMAEALHRASERLAAAPRDTHGRSARGARDASTDWLAGPTCWWKKDGSSTRPDKRLAGRQSHVAAGPGLDGGVVAGRKSLGRKWRGRRWTLTAQALGPTSVKTHVRARRGGRAYLNQLVHGWTCACTTVTAARAIFLCLE
jgi:hypothetical protein